MDSTIKGSSDTENSSGGDSSQATGVSWMRRFYASCAEHRGGILSCVLLMSLALGVRLLHHHETVVLGAMRADAGKYIKAAFNLNAFGAYSEERTRSAAVPPKTRTDLSPGYPLFLTFFMGAKSPAELESNVLFAQAILGSLTTGLTFLLALSALGLFWASLAGILTALSPHLIAMDGYILTESLFTFVLSLGVWILSLSWQRSSWSLTLVSGLVLAFSARVRAVAFALQFFIAPLFLLNAKSPGFSRKSSWMPQVVMILLGFAVIYGLHGEFVKVAVTHEKPSLKMHRRFDYTIREAPKKRVVIAGPWEYLSRSVHPPNFFVRNETHIRIKGGQDDWKKRSEGSFRDHPMAYLKWNLGGRLFYLWHWDNSYHGGVYMYPMTRKGFEQNTLLGVIYKAMHVLHWPLFVLALAAPVLLVWRLRKGTMVISERLLFVPALVFIYFLAVLSMLSWLPRYTIPARPVSFILAAASLSWIVARIRSLSAQAGELKPGGRRKHKRRPS